MHFGIGRELRRTGDAFGLTYNLFQRGGFLAAPKQRCHHRIIGGRQKVGPDDVAEFGIIFLVMFVENICAVVGQRRATH